MGTISGQIGQSSGQILPASVHLTSEEGSLEHARTLAKQLVSMRASRRGNQEAAVAELTRENEFNSWLVNLLKNSKKPTIHLHLYNRLTRALAKEVEAQERRIAQLKETLEIINGSPAAGLRVDQECAEGAEAPSADQVGPT